MLRSIKIIFLVLFVQLITCCSSSTLIDSETRLNEDSRVKWVVTKTDTLIDFRKGIDGFAKFKNNKILFRTNNGSVKKYNVTEFKTIYVAYEVDYTNFFIAGGLVVIGTTLYIIGMGSGPGG